MYESGLWLIRCLTEARSAVSMMSNSTVMKLRGQRLTPSPHCDSVYFHSGCFVSSVLLNSVTYNRDDGQRKPFECKGMQLSFSEQLLREISTKLIISRSVSQTALESRPFGNVWSVRPLRIRAGSVLPFCEATSRSCRNRLAGPVQTRSELRSAEAVPIRST